jgi:hypothetical protein
MCPHRASAGVCPPRQLPADRLRQRSGPAASTRLRSGVADEPLKGRYPVSYHRVALAIRPLVGHRGSFLPIDGVLLPIQRELPG